MLFASYQASEVLEHENIKEYSIWAIPVKSIKEFFISSRFCAPNRAELLVFFECDDFFRIDKIAWYQALKSVDENGGDYSTLDAKKYITTSADDMHSEFLVRGIDKNRIIKTIPIFDVGDELDILGLAQNGENHYAERILRDKARSVALAIKSPIEINSAFGVSRQYAEYRSVLESKKMAFELVYLPLAVESIFANYTPLSIDITYYSEMIYRNFQKIAFISNKFTKWSYNDCSLFEYDSIVEQLGHYVIENYDVFKRLQRGPTIGRNELCPCGSGKKWKKCHGLWLD